MTTDNPVSPETQPLGVTPEEVDDIKISDADLLNYSLNIMHRPLYAFSFETPEEMSKFITEMEKAGISKGRIGLVMNVDIEFFEKLRYLNPLSNLFGYSLGAMVASRVGADEKGYEMQDLSDPEDPEGSQAEEEEGKT